MSAKDLDLLLFVVVMCLYLTFHFALYKRHKVSERTNCIVVMVVSALLTTSGFCVQDYVMALVWAVSFSYGVYLYVLEERKVKAVQKDEG